MTQIGHLAINENGRLITDSDGNPRVITGDDPLGEPQCCCDVGTFDRYVRSRMDLAASLKQFATKEISTGSRSGIDISLCRNGTGPGVSADIYHESIPEQDVIDHLNGGDVPTYEHPAGCERYNNHDDLVTSLYYYGEAYPGVHEFRATFRGKLYLWETISPGYKVSGYWPGGSYLQCRSFYSQADFPPYTGSPCIVAETDQHGCTVGKDCAMCSNAHQPDSDECSGDPDNYRCTRRYYPTYDYFDTLTGGGFHLFDSQFFQENWRILTTDQNDPLDTFHWQSGTSVVVSGSELNLSAGGYWPGSNYGMNNIWIWLNHVVEMDNPPITLNWNVADRLFQFEDRQLTEACWSGNSVGGSVPCGSYTDPDGDYLHGGLGSCAYSSYWDSQEETCVGVPASGGRCPHIYECVESNEDDYDAEYLSDYFPDLKIAARLYSVSGTDCL